MPVFYSRVRGSLPKYANPVSFPPRSQSHATLKINPSHAVIRTLKSAQASALDAAETQDMAMMLYDTAALVSGCAIEDPQSARRR